MCDLILLMFTRFICLILGGFLGVCNVGGVSRYDYESANIVVKNKEVLDLKNDGEMLELGVDLFEVSRPVSSGSCDMGGVKFFYDVPLGFFAKESLGGCGFGSMGGEVEYYLSFSLPENLKLENYSEVDKGVYELEEDETLDSEMGVGVYSRVCWVEHEEVYFVEVDWSVEKGDQSMGISEDLSLDDFALFCNSFHSESI